VLSNVKAGRTCSTHGYLINVHTILFVKYEGRHTFNRRMSSSGTWSCVDIV
jgi:hypothetical protein